MKFAPAAIMVAALAVAACSQQAAFNTAKNVECQQNGGTAPNCARSYADEFQDMKQEQPESR